MTINVIPRLLFCRSGLCPALLAIHLRSMLQATISFAGIYFLWAVRKVFKKFFVYVMMTNVMVKTCFNQEIIKISNLIQEKIKNNACPRPKFNRRPNLSESRISPNVPKFRSVDWTHDMIIVKWHLLIWHKRKFCALTNRPPAQPHERVNDYQRYSMLIVLPLRSMSCTFGNSSSFHAAGDDQFCRYLFPVSAKKGF